MTPPENDAQQPSDKWFEQRDHGGGTHSTTCWQHHPGCAYLIGRMEASLAIEAAAEDAARTSRDFGRGFMEAAKIARRYRGYDHD